MIKFPQKVYDYTKYLVLIVIPAFSTAYLGVDAAVDLPAENVVVKIAAVVAALLGTLVGISAVQYNNSDERFDGVFEVRVTPPDEYNDLTHVDLPNTTVNAITDKGEALMKVVPSR